MTIYGFTGTRHNPTDAQLSWLWNFVRTHGRELHHGACVGADLAAHQAARDNGMPRIVVHPPTDQKLVAHECLKLMPGVEIREPHPYLKRNRNIVFASHHLLALPDGPPRPHSGTWYTINFAEQERIPVTICYPDGRIESQ